MGGEPSVIWSWLESTLAPLRLAMAWLARWADVFGLCLGAAAVVLAFLHSANKPSADAWSGLHALPVSQVAAVVLVVICQATVVVRGRVGRGDRGLADACREVAAYIDDSCPGVRLSEVGVHIWKVSGIRRQHLRRAGTFLLIGDRARSGIRWRQGKGVVGFAWERRETLVRDLEAIRARAASRDEYEQLPGDDRLGLSWAEFQRTPQYQAVAASPLYKRGVRAGSAEVVGVLAIDFLSKGHCGELANATRDPAFASVVGVCEAALDFRKNGE